jgi:hypothetical protein
LPPRNYLRFRLGPDRVAILGARIKSAGESMVGHEIGSMPATRKATR